jgi:hypothetical protein
MSITLHNYGSVSLRRIVHYLNGNQTQATHMGGWDQIKDWWQSAPAQSKQQRLNKLWNNLYTHETRSVNYSQGIKTFITFSQLHELATADRKPTLPLA